MSTDMYDANLLGILQNEGQIAKFLDVVMGFLYRRTDFYHVMKSKEDNLGFPAGVAPRLLIQAYEKYESMAQKRDASTDTRKIIPTRPDQQELKNKVAADVVEKTKPHKSTQPSCSDKKPKDNNTAQPLAVQHNQKVFQENPDSHNGAIRDGYRWAQTLKDCDLRVQVPPEVTKAKQIKVSIKKKHITVIYTNEGSQPMTLIDSDLQWEINLEESMWSLIPKDCVHINLEKVQERWWENVFVDEDKINTQKIDAVVPMEELDVGAQSTVDKLMYDEHQKHLGQPTSDEQKVQETLKKAWNAEGSPFQGTPYDPSLVNITGQNT